MMVKVVESKRDLNDFVYFIKKLYKDDLHYIFPIFSVLKKELFTLVLKAKKYKAILSVRENKVVGRLLYTIEFNKKKNRFICYFSAFDAINDTEVAKELFNYMELDVINQNVLYCEGTFSPYDPDTRRGILVDGFDDDPAVLTSYNAPYYSNLIESCGYYKAYDTFGLKADINSQVQKRLETVETYFDNHYDVRIDQINLNKLDNDIHDIHEVLLTATTEINYQEAPSIEMIKQVAENLRLLINPKLIRIARENLTNKPVGFCLVFPDFNQILKKTKGRIRPIYILINLKKITRVRGTMQYVIPKYQNTGLIGYMYKKVYDHFDSMGINEFEGGTVMEENEKSLHAFDKFGGRIAKTYRIYGKELKS